MRITQHTDYGLRVLMYVGGNDGRLVTIAEIAARFGISRAHLMKVVNRLVRAGFLVGKRGKGGGLSLARLPERIRIGDVFRAMEADRRATEESRRAERDECFSLQGAATAHGQALDPAIATAYGQALDRALADARDEFLAVLDRSTLADLLGEPLKQRLAMMMRVQGPVPARR